MYMYSAKAEEIRVSQKIAWFGGISHSLIVKSTRLSTHLVGKSLRANQAHEMVGSKPAQSGLLYQSTEYTCTLRVPKFRGTLDM